MASDDETLSGSLQESVLTLLMFDKPHGAVAAGLLSADHFDTRYRDIAKRALAYRRDYKQPPGQAHVDDLFDHVLNVPQHKEFRAYRQILTGVLEQSKTLNAEYVATRLNEFVRRQTLKAAVLEAGQRYSQGGDGLVVDVENILFKALKSPNPDTDLGMFLGDKRFPHLLTNQTGVTYMTGIDELDKRGFGMTRKELMLFIGVKGTGKSMALVHFGRSALMQHARVAHITLEMPVLSVAARYYRNFFAMGKRPEKFKQVRFEVDELGKLVDFVSEEGKTKVNLTNPKTKQILEDKRVQWQRVLNNLVIRSFPSGQLTVAALEAYLEGLEHTHRFVPDVLIVDYPDLMKQDRAHLRESLGQTFVELRGLLDQRNMCGVCPTQANRAGARAKQVSDTDVAEDWSKGMTADMSLIYSQTKAEKEMGLARLFVDKNRNDIDKFSVLISQNYALGQFCVDSVYMDANRYWNKLKAASGQDEDEE